jgi:NifU-like protein involved in Fe-S cluster formation
MDETASENGKDVFQKLHSFWLGESSEPFSEKVLELAYEPLHVGSMENSSVSASIKDECGDDFELFLKIEDGVISDASFLSEGCGAIVACGSALCELIIGKPVEEAQRISEDDIIRFLDGLPASHKHCAEQVLVAMNKSIKSMKSSVKSDNQYRNKIL